NGFTAMMFLLPLLVIVPVGIIGFTGYEWIAGLLSEKNEIVKDYLWVTYIIAFSMAYFEVFYAWAKVHMRSVLGNFLKEVFHRVAITVMLFMIFFEWITVSGFIYGIAVTYALRMLIMLVSAIRVRKPVILFKPPQNAREVISYSAFVILAGAVSVVFLDIDKFMIGQFKSI
ncbi:MAG: lipopolysaccharide biosynthesis protein, partial [Sinomicrobium sp.]|nr:lipopolysaccharide biosynthesis protein [Sinomicrobium sp.]